MAIMMVMKFLSPPPQLNLGCANAVTLMTGFGMSVVKSS